jgi:hypothetical protein
VSDIENQLMRLTRKYLAVVFGLLLATLILVSTLRQPRKHASGLPVQLASDTCYCDLYSRQIVVLRMSREGEIAIGSERIHAYETMCFDTPTPESRRNFPKFPKLTAGLLARD